jgi:hypothetical protein
MTLRGHALFKEASGIKHEEPKERIKGEFSEKVLTLSFGGDKVLP